MTRSETQSRKRPAPGTSPPPVQNQSLQPAQHTDPSQLSNEDFLAWGAGQSLTQAQQPQSGVFDLDNFDDMEARLNPENVSNQLVRRNQNQELALDNRDQQLWDAGVPPNALPEGDDDYAELEQRALAAKKDALSKKPPKQIQPFIQKLWSLLTDNANTDLIRWTPKGDSFIVIDEERFAAEQLPTYFKHKQYPSFVRQLNMYGFHKRVGLTDNSMKASEAKSKSPGEYENPFFQRDRPILQWLITKPKQTSSKGRGKKRKEDDDDSGEENNTNATEPQQANATRREDASHRKSLDLVSVPKNQLVQFQDEISQLKRSQSQINQMIARFQHENNQYIRRASAQHERHEQSINAILQFLATFYAQGQDSSNIQNMFHGAIHNQQPHGNVQEMGDIDESLSPSTQSQLARIRRQPLLLQAPPTDGGKSVTPEAPSRPTSNQQQRSSPAVTSKSKSETPAPRPASGAGPSDKPLSESPPQPAPPGQRQDNQAQGPNASSPSDDMLAVINNMNANTPGGAPNIDVNLALRNYEDMNNGPMTPEQRDSMLSMLANTSGLSPSTSNALLATTGANSSSNAVGTPQTALSQWAANKDQLDMLQRLQQEQDSKVQKLAGRIQPLSPSGSIPGFEQAYNNGDVNFDNYLNSDFFNSDGGGGAGSTDGDAWGLDGNFNLNEGEDYFGNTSANVDSGANLASNDGNMTFDNFDAQNLNTDTDALFNDSGFEAADNAIQESSGEGGRVIGSVTNSEGGHTPTNAQEAEDGGERRRKRQRL